MEEKNELNDATALMLVDGYGDRRFLKRRAAIEMIIKIAQAPLLERIKELEKKIK